MSDKEFPKPLKFTKLLGPSFLILAMGLGSGEIILWPYLSSNYGLGLAWGAILGITFQFFINMEIERYALIKGESVFVGINRLWHKFGYWFIVSTFIGFGLPGIIAASAEVLADVVGLESYRWLAIGLLLFIGVILSFGRVVYDMMERLTKTIILLGVPFIFVLTIIIASKTDWLALLNGIIGQGDGFSFLPPGIALATFFAAFAYSGAGGNLNLTQSIYIKEEGYGMGKYAQKISGLFAKGKEEKIRLRGHSFAMTEENIVRAKKWWHIINLEHSLIFWLIGSVSMLMLMLLSFVTTHGRDGVEEGINFVLYEGSVIGQILSPLVGILFLLVVAIMLFQTQLGIMDSTSRIMSENLAIQKLNRDQDRNINLSKLYYIFVWSQIAFGILLFLFGIQEPKFLIVLGAVINAIAMFVHIGLVFVLNHRELPKIFRPAWWRKAIIILIFIFFGFFSALVLLNTF